MTLEADGRTEAVVGGLTAGRTGALGLTDVGVGMGGRNALGLTVGPVGTLGRNAEEVVAGFAALGAVLGVVAAFTGLRAGGGFGLSLLESFVKSTISRALPLLLSFVFPAFAESLTVVSSDRSMTRLAAPEVLIVELPVEFCPRFPTMSGVIAGFDFEL